MHPVMQRGGTYKTKLRNKKTEEDKQKKTRGQGSASHRSAVERVGRYTAVHHEPRRREIKAVRRNARRSTRRRRIKTIQRRRFYGICLHILGLYLEAGRTLRNVGEAKVEGAGQALGLAMASGGQAGVGNLQGGFQVLLEGLLGEGP